MRCFPNERRWGLTARLPKRERARGWFVADVRAIHAVGSALIARLGREFEASVWPGAAADKPSCSFQLAGSADLVQSPTFASGVVFFLYRVQPNQHARMNVARASASTGRPSLALDLHYLMIPWATSAQDEALLLAWTMRALEARPVFAAGDLADGGFAEGEAVQFILGDLSNEDLMRIWDAIDPPYRVSVPYIARVIHLDLDPPAEGAPVVVRRLVFGPMPQGSGG